MRPITLPDSTMWFLGFVSLLIILNFFYKLIGANLSQISQRWFRSSVFVNYLFFIGTVIHELSHALLCLLLWVPISKLSLFSPKKVEGGGYRLGYVEHRKVGPIRTLVIGIAPILGCGLATYLAYVWALPNITILTPLTPETFLQSLEWLLLNPTHWQNYLFYYIAVSCALAGDPSEADLSSMPILVFLAILIGGLFYYTKDFFLWKGIGKTLQFFIDILAPIFQGITLLMLFEAGVLIVLLLLTRFLAGSKSKHF